ncbi:MarR family winged helix-turn-helix transcriptional regulator [Nocardia arthritidis]|uniref:MarR family transcriptional regulator n=1 Tax=Nocardia arthritidis TaxID=228602 RepID=A0A6G9YNG9_9NOCA|nr:MarR family transcriptional regulator [Nocardia arthritidis]QIS14731.1 MarR family transcriptional regulator [Nocardia arthritidis]
MPQDAEPRKTMHPTPGDLEILGYIPLLSGYFRNVRGEMPEEMRAIFERHKLTARHGAVLPQLMSGEAVSVSELAGRLGVSLSTASELVGDLSRAGLATRQEDPGNRRRTLVTLPEQHRRAVESFIAARSAPLLRALARLSPRDRAGFVAGLTEWAHEVQGYGANC